MSQPARLTDEPLCQACGERPGDIDDGPLVNSLLCRECATEIAYDLAELEREDHRVGLCCSNAPDCGGLCDRSSH